MRFYRTRSREEHEKRARHFRTPEFSHRELVARERARKFEEREREREEREALNDTDRV